MIRFSDESPAGADASGTPDDADTPDAATPAEGHPPPDTERLGDEIAELAAHIHAATYRLLVLLAEFDARNGWGGGGFRSCAHWLSWRTGSSPGTAREKMRVARALPALPAISAAMRAGELSYSKVRALTRVAEPATETELLEFARHATTAQVERFVRAWRQVDRIEAAELDRERHEARALSLYEDEDGSWVLRGRLEPEVGAVLRKALDAAAAELHAPAAPTPAPDTPTYRQRQADAIGLLAERALTSNESVRRAERYQVVVHVGPERVPATAHGGPLDAAPGGARDAALVAAPGDVQVPDVSAETSRRVLCDATTVRMTHDERGGVLDVGRRTRTVPPALRRALEYRDGTCRFPGCSVRHTDAHHVRHWAVGGRTALPNLVLLCRFHHRAVHEGGVRVEPRPGGRFRFTTAGGRPIPDVPPPPADLPDDPAAALVERNRVRGVDPGPWTPTPNWHGESLDLGFAIDVLRPKAPRPECPPAERPLG